MEHKKEGGIMAKKISGSVGKGGKNKPQDTSGQVVVSDTVSGDTGNPAPSAVLHFSAPASSSPQAVTVAFPIGEDFEFFYDPAELGAVASLDFQLDLLPTLVSGTPQVHVSLAIVQGEAFIAPPTVGTPSVNGTEGGWVLLQQFGLRAEDFVAADGGPERPDFGLPFEFGYAFSATYSTVPLDVRLQLDNMEATINTVPEPTALALLLVLGVPLIWRRVVRV
jgi:hypothetical protein